MENTRYRFYRTAGQALILSHLVQESILLRSTVQREGRAPSPARQACNSQRAVTRPSLRQRALQDGITAIMTIKKKVLCAL